MVKKQRLKLVHWNRRMPDIQLLKTLEPFAERPAVLIDFRKVTNLGTKVLPDMLTIDEIFLGCSNPKVGRLKTEVYGYLVHPTIAF